MLDHFTVKKILLSQIIFKWKNNGIFEEFFRDLSSKNNYYNLLSCIYTRMYYQYQFNTQYYNQILPSFSKILKFATNNVK